MKTIVFKGFLFNSLSVYYAIQNTSIIIAHRRISRKIHYHPVNIISYHRQSNHDQIFYHTFHFFLHNIPSICKQQYISTQDIDKRMQLPCQSKISSKHCKNSSCHSTSRTWNPRDYYHWTHAVQEVFAYKKVCNKNKYDIPERPDIFPQKLKHFSYTFGKITFFGHFSAHAPQF